jgi:glycosyltransferase involved in cell wall biosynthesis
LELSGISDAQMVELMQGTRALLMPSFEEGWGMPVAEALAVGTRVICSDIPALRASCQATATILHPLDGARWSEEIRLALSAPPQCDIESSRAQCWHAHTRTMSILLRTQLDDS